MGKHDNLSPASARGYVAICHTIYSQSGTVKLGRDRPQENDLWLQNFVIFMAIDDRVETNPKFL